jgi:hypothetical protein
MFQRVQDNGGCETRCDLENLLARRMLAVGVDKVHNGRSVFKKPLSIG